MITITEQNPLEVEEFSFKQMETSKIYERLDTQGFGTGELYMRLHTSANGTGLYQITPCNLLNVNRHINETDRYIARPDVIVTIKG